MAANVGLMDLKRASRVVPIGDQSVTMLAVSAEGIVRLLLQFPDVKRLFNGGLKAFSLERLITEAPPLVAELIACGSDSPGDPEVIAFASKLGLGTQLLLLEGVIDATLEGGMAPFVARLTRMLEGFGVSSPVDTGSPTEEQPTT